MGKTYAEIFPIGCRVKVNAAMRREGTDHEWHGHEGKVVSHGHWIGVKMERTKRGWATDTIFICAHNLVPAALTPAKVDETG